MSAALYEALEKMNLEDGDVFNFDVRGHQVVIQVLPEQKKRRQLDANASPQRSRSVVSEPSSSALPFQYGEGIMLEAWVDLPRPDGGIPGINKPGPLPEFPAPEIPANEDAA